MLQVGIRLGFFLLSGLVSSQFLNIGHIPGNKTLKSTYLYGKEFQLLSQWGMT